MNPDQTKTPANGSEPTATMTAVPVWLLILLLVMTYVAALAFDFYGAWFEPKVYGPYASLAEVELYQPVAGGPPGYARGKILYEQTCALCHNSDGAGKAGQSPPLAGSDWVNTEGVNRLIHIPLLGLTGPIEVSGKQYNFAAPMTPFSSLSDSDIAAVLTYIRTSFGNNASPVTPDQVAAVRSQIGNRTQVLTVQEALKLPE